MAQNQNQNLTGDPYPWVTVDFDGSEYRVHTAQEDGVDENGIVWQGWVFAPRPKEIWQEGVSMFLIWLVSGLIRIPLTFLTLLLLIPVAVVFVVITSPVRIFSKSTHETLCDKFLNFLLTFVFDGKAQDI